MSCLPLSPGIRLGQPDRLDDLADLALVGRVRERLRRQESGPDELLGDGRRASRPAGQRVEAGADDGRRVETGIRPEALVLDRRRRIEHLIGDACERRDLATQRAQACQLDLPGPVVDDRLLFEPEIVECLAGVGQALCVEVVRGHREQRPSAGRQDRHEDEDDRDGDEDAAEDRSASPGRATMQRASMTLPPGQGGLHLSPHDSIGFVNDRTCAAASGQTPRRTAL